MQLSFFDEAEATYDEAVLKPAAEEVLPAKQSKKKKGQRNLDLKDFPEEFISPYSVSKEQLEFRNCKVESLRLIPLLQIYPHRASEIL
ncbi:MAG: hypothetical protein ACI4DR_03095 [Roseburia sp.]